LPDELNRDSPLRPAFFVLDSSDLDDAGRGIVSGNVDVLKKYPQWVVTIEGHCDERGTAEYNLALGERRAAAVKTYMVSLGIAPDRLRTVSYGKEFPFDQAHSEDAWSKNRRAHFADHGEMKGMTMTTSTRLAVAAACVLALAAHPAAQNREHQQQAAELRILQEQQQQLSVAIAQLTDALKALNTRLDEAAAATAKASPTRS
jgi:peptidoglycan-associated lipoprotein